MALTSRTAISAAFDTFSGSHAYSIRYAPRVRPAWSIEPTEYTSPEFFRRSMLNRVE